MANQTGQLFSGKIGLIMTRYLDSGERLKMSVLMKWPICLDTFKKFCICISNRVFLKMLGIPVILGTPLHGCSDKCLKGLPSPVKIRCK